MELNQEQLAAAETMSLEELKALALKEAGEVVETAAPAKVEQPRDEKGKFVAAKGQEDELDNTADNLDNADEEPTTTIYRKEIDNGNGVIEVFEAESLEELVDKIAEGKRNASIKIRELTTEKKAADEKTQQISKDDEYVVQQRLKDNPKATIKDVVTEVIEEHIAKQQRSEDAQSRFVATHLDYIANPDNGARIVSEVQRLGYTEFTTEGLEKAYQSLKKSGLLQLKTTGADDATEVEAKDKGGLPEPKVEATQQRSSKKSSTVSTRSGSVRTAVNTQPTLDEAYNLPLDKLRELANKQLAERNGKE